MNPKTAGSSTHSSRLYIQPFADFVRKVCSAQNAALG